MKCEIMARSVCLYSDRAGGPVGVEAFCQTHNMKVEGLGSIAGMCPIGRIEDATEKGLAEISEAIKNARENDLVI